MCVSVFGGKTLENESSSHRGYLSPHRIYVVRTVCIPCPHTCIPFSHTRFRGTPDNQQKHENDHSLETNFNRSAVFRVEHRLPEITFTLRESMLGRTKLRRPDHRPPVDAADQIADFAHAPGIRRYLRTSQVRYGHAKFPVSKATS
jgi:hypothetical protein